MANNNPYPTKNVSKSGPARAKVIHSAFMFFEMPMYCHLETTQRRLVRERCCRVAFDSLTLSLALVTALSLSVMPPAPSSPLGGKLVHQDGPHLEALEEASKSQEASPAKGVHKALRELARERSRRSRSEDTAAEGE